MRNTRYEKRDTHLYGPVPSRRLGRSLGVDIVPLKTCTLDCIYCQLGRGGKKVLKRKIYVSVDNVLAELKHRVGQGLQADYITVSGSGEPTLHLELGRLIDGIRKITNIPVAILTNGTLLYDPAVRAACCKADVVLPSLDAGDEQAFARINRPHKSLSLAKLVEGLCAFRREFAGKLWLEVFVVEGINTDIEQIDKIAHLIERIGPDKVQFNTAVRPAAQPDIRRVEPEKLADIAARLASILAAEADASRPAENVEVIADFAHVRHQGLMEKAEEGLLAMLERRPCSLNDICSGLGLGPNEALKHIASLQQAGVVQAENKDGTVFFSAK